jgi:hypothetical protein
MNSASKFFQPRTGSENRRGVLFCILSFILTSVSLLTSRSQLKKHDLTLAEFVGGFAARCMSTKEVSPVSAGSASYIDRRLYGTSAAVNV